MQRFTQFHPGLVVVIILTFLLTACGGNATPTPTRTWEDWQERLLLEGTMRQWRAADDETRFATAFIWVDRLVDWKDIEEAHAMAVDLMSCIDEVQSAPPEQRADEIAGACALFLNWHMKWMDE